MAGRGWKDVGGGATVVVEVAAAADVACDGGGGEGERSVVVDACALQRVVGVDAGVGQGCVAATVDEEAATTVQKRQVRPHMFQRGRWKESFEGSKGKHSLVWPGCPRWYRRSEMPRQRCIDRHHPAFQKRQVGPAGRWKKSFEGSKGEHSQNRPGCPRWYRRSEMPCHHQ